MIQIATVPYTDKSHPLDFGRGDPSAESEEDEGNVVLESVLTIVDLNGDGPKYCPCRTFCVTGKYCYHLWGLAWHEARGPYFSCQGTTSPYTMNG